MSHTFRVRLRDEDAAQLQELCRLTQQPISGAIRAYVEYVLRDPALSLQLLTEPLEDRRSDEQRAAWERDEATLLAVDLGELLADNDAV